MRLESAFVVLTVAAFAAGCSIPVAPSPRPDPAIASLKELGVEGRTYVADLGAERNFALNRVFNVGNDLLLEDIAGALVYVDGATLTTRWAYYGLPRPFDEAPDFTDTLITGVSQNRLFVLSRRNGLDELDPAPVAVVPSAAPVANDTTIYVPTYRTADGNKTLVAVSLTNGFRGWGIRTEADIEVDLEKGGLHGGDMIYAAASNGTVHGIPAFVATHRDPEPAWTVDLRTGVHRNLAVSGDDLGIVTDDHRLIVLDRITGAYRWEVFPRSSAERATTGAQFSSRHAFYAIGGELRAFDRATGLQSWAVPGATTFVAERGARTILSDDRGTLIAVETGSGKVLGRRAMPGWSFPTRTKADAKAADPTIVGISSSGVIVGVELGW